MKEKTSLVLREDQLQVACSKLQG